MVRIDGSQGEGGGQVLRSAPGLSLVTGQPFEIHQIRGQRRKPGLLRQHLTCVQAAAEISGAEVLGASLGSGHLVFRPGALRAGDHHFSIGSAGSTLLVLQAVLPGLLQVGGRLTVEGGTHNMASPPWHFVEHSFLPLLRQMGFGVEGTLVRPGFYPAGGGRIEISVEAGGDLRPLELLACTGERVLRAHVLLSGLPRHVGNREAMVICEALGLDRRDAWVEDLRPARGPGNAIVLSAAHASHTVCFAGFGERGKRAEDVATGVIEAYRAWAALGVPVDEHLADQLMIPLALAGGRYRTGPLTLHSQTNLETIRRFVPEGPRQLIREQSVEIACTGRG